MRTGIVLIFSLTTFLGSVLLFTAEPMIGKMVLPLFGGTPAVWNTCLLFFQMVVLAGYAFSGAQPIRSPREERLVDRQIVSAPILTIYAGLLALGYFLQPIAIPAMSSSREWAAINHPTLPLIEILVSAAALPLVMAAAGAPLLQRWFSSTGHPRAHDPYFLYAASNAGSLLALAAYPFVIEPSLNLEAQARLWRKGFLLLAILLIGCRLIAPQVGRAVGMQGGDRERDDAREAYPPGQPLVRRWLALSFIPSSWLMGVTAYLTTDLAPMPMLWIIPLVLYLLSFIVAFVGPESTLVRLAEASLPVCVMPLALVLSAGFVHAFWIPLHLLAFFAGALACHAALARRRPPARYLSSFYITIALGGLLGGAFNAILAPVLFNRIAEYPLAIVLGCLFAGADDRLATISTRRKWLMDLILPGAVFALTALLVTDQAGVAESVLGVFGVIAASGLGFYALVKARRRPLQFALAAGAVMAASGLTQGKSGRLLHVERNFFGVVRVTEDDAHTVHRLFHGSTLHGQQGLDPDSAREPSTYFTRSGPIGQLFAALGSRLDRPGTHVGIVGLGAGTLAAYARPNHRWTFYEIDPAIERIARDPRFFTYLRDSQAVALHVVLGDARLKLHQAPERAYRVIILDAFSSDSLPVHLVTRAAIRLYRSKLEAGGVLAFNLSNRYLDLDPLMGRQAEDAGLVCRIAYDLDVSEVEKSAGKLPSIWAVMAASEGDLGKLTSDPRWREPRTRADSRAWTDDYSDLARYLRWSPVRRPTGARSADKDR
jgi:hypothetical protein